VIVRNDASKLYFLVCEPEDRRPKLDYILTSTIL